MALTHTPLTEEQKALPSGMVLPSGEGNYFDFAQHHDNNAGSGINFPFTEDNSGSGLIATYGPVGSGNTGSPSGTFVTSGLSVPFSNAQDVETTQIDDFAIFNTYVHYETGVAGTAVQIPFLSTYVVAPNFDPYKL
jgi:hypothetical protein